MSMYIGSENYLEQRIEALEAGITTAVIDLLDGAPGALDTLNELAAALGDDANFAATVTAAIASQMTAAEHAAVSHVGLPGVPDIGAFAAAIGYAERTSDFATANTTWTAVTGMDSITVQVPAGAWEIEASVALISVTNAGGYVALEIRGSDGTTAYARGVATCSTAGGFVQIRAYRRFAAGAIAAGSTVFKLGMFTGASAGSCSLTTVSGQFPISVRAMAL